MCFVFISEQRATCATYSINWLVFITEMKSVYSAVRTGSLNRAVCASSLKGNELLVKYSIDHFYITDFPLCVCCTWRQTNTYILVLNCRVRSCEMNLLVCAVCTLEKKNSLYKAHLVLSLEAILYSKALWTEVCIPISHPPDTFRPSV